MPLGSFTFCCAQATGSDGAGVVVSAGPHSKVCWNVQSLPTAVNRIFYNNESSVFEGCGMTVNARKMIFFEHTGICTKLKNNNS